MTFGRPDLILILLGILTGAATVAGGLLALRLSNRIHLILGFSAGAVIGVALFDLLPESMDLGAPAADATAMVGAGFLAYLAATRAVGGGAGRTGLALFSAAALLGLSLALARRLNAPVAEPSAKDLRFAAIGGNG